MATDLSFIKYVCDQIAEVGEVTYKKMFGEFMVYVNAKPVLLVCDNTVFVKKLECIQNFMQEASVGIPYNGAKEHYILDVDDIILCKEVVTELEKVTPIPKSKKKK